MQGSVATENPTNSLSSLLVSFASGHSEDYEDDNSQLPTEGSQAEGARHRELGGPTPLLMVLESRSSHWPQLVGHQPPRLASQKKCRRKGPLQVR